MLILLSTDYFPSLKDKINQKNSYENFYEKWKQYNIKKLN